MAGVWMPQPGPQTAAIQAKWCNVVLFGGAKYGGKTDFLLGDFLQDVPTYRHNWHGIIVRRTMPELEEVIQRSHEIYPKTKARYKTQKNTWEFREGSTLMFRAIERDTDISKFQGWSKPWIGLDEAGNWMTDHILRRFAIPNRRWGRAEVPLKRIRLTANPHGVGHAWLKRLFIDKDPLGFTPFVDESSGLSCMFIPSRIEHNRLGVERDPQYARSLEGLGSPALVRAWLLGDWSVLAGAYFPEFSIENNVIPACELPAHWTRLCSYDWGYSAPFSVGWYAIASEDRPDLNIPKNAMVKYREWYGADKQDKGLKLTETQVAQGILERERADEEITYRVADPSIFSGATPVAETFSKKGIVFRPADNARVPGWQQMRLKFKQRQLLYFNTCQDSIRLIPILQHDEKRPEDLDTRQNDHLADGDRYAVTSRGSPTDTPTADKGIKYLKDYTLNELFDLEDEADIERGDFI